LYVYSWLLTIITFNINAIIWFNNQYSRIITDRIFINVKLPTPIAVYKKIRNATGVDGFRCSSCTKLHGS